MDPEQLMQAAVDAAERGVRGGQSPFGCAIALDGELIVATHNVVWQTTDITAHAEVNAIRQACQKLDRILLEGCEVAATCEPCPMCMAALHWARAETVYFGATISDAGEAGFNELSLDARKLLALGGSQVVLQGGVMRERCRQIFQTWKEQGGEAY